MVSYVIKRDGSRVEFSRSKIKNAISKAMKSSGYNDEKAELESERLTGKIDKILRSREEKIGVEEIQDMVEKVLMDSGDKDLAKLYILYRKQHEGLRETVSMIKDIELIDDYIGRKDWQVKENANMDYSIQGLNNYLNSKVITKYWLNKVYPEEVKNAHVNGDIHIHQLNFLGPYCVGWDLRDLLIKGFGGVSGKVSSKPARHFRTALMQIVNFFYTLQGESAGAQAFSNFDTYLAPFIRYDGLSHEQAKQAMQEFIFNMNVPTRVGFQTPFTNLTLDLKVPEHMKNEAVIIGGKLIDAKYGDFQEEVNMVNRAFAEIMSEGDSIGRVFTFPIPTYNITKEFDWENPVYDPIWEMTSKYGIPYFSNFINSDMNPEDARSMCCRLRLDTRELRKRGGGLFGANPLTGSIGVFTINLPRIGYLSKDETDFFGSLGTLMDTAKSGLEAKRKFIERLTESGLYPYSKYYLSEIKEAYGGYWKNHFSTIGIVGMNEACINFIGKDITTAEGKSFAVKVLDFMRERLEDYQIETNSIYNLEATPAESTAYALAARDKEKYKTIRVANEAEFQRGASPYYTNSSHLPVGHTDDLFEALSAQDDLQARYTGGTVMHLFLGESMPSAGSTKQLVKKVAENFRLPYYTITPTFSICPKHGYLPGAHEYCPKCDEILLKKVEK
jgi:ribonucleoside-triphosphate reductase